MHTVCKGNEISGSLASGLTISRRSTSDKANFAKHFAIGISLRHPDIDLATIERIIK